MVIYPHWFPAVMMVGILGTVYLSGGRRTVVFMLATMGAIDIIETVVRAFIAQN